METYKQKLEAYEHEHLLTSGEVQPAVAEKSVEAAPVISKSEASQKATEAAGQQNDAREALARLQTPENTSQAATPSMVTNEMKQVGRRQSLKRVQRRETKPLRAFSKVVHQPAIRVVSEAAGKTVTRPSGLLGGGLVAFLGSGSYLIMAKYLGFTYNYSLSLALFAGGFVLGLVLELFVHFMTASRRQTD